MKFKKLFVGLALLGSALALTTLPTNAAVKTNLHEDFNYKENWSQSENKNIYKVLNGATVSLSNVERESLIVNIPLSVVTGNPMVLINNGGATLSDKDENENSKIILNFSFKTSGVLARQVRLNINGNKQIKLLSLSASATLHKIYYNLGGTDIQVSDKTLTQNTWHDVVVILSNNGGLNSDNTSQDKVTTYLDGELLYDAYFASGVDFDGTINNFNYLASAKEITKESEKEIPNDFYLDNLYVTKYQEEFTKVETKSSLRVNYDIDKQETTKVDLRFGGMIPATVFDSNAKFGVIVLQNTQENYEKLTNFVNGSVTTAAAFAGVGYSVECDPKQVNENGVEDSNGNYYQFAWVIDNMEGHYDFEFVSVMYMEYNGSLYLSKPKKASVESVAQAYVKNASTLGLPEALKNALDKLVPKTA